MALFLDLNILFFTSSLMRSITSSGNLVGMYVNLAMRIKSNTDSNTVQIYFLYIKKIVALVSLKI